VVDVARDPESHVITAPNITAQYCNATREIAALKGLQLIVAPCKPNDIVIALSDGIHDNLDPEVRGLTPTDVDSSYSATTTWDSLDKELQAVIKYRFTMQLVTDNVIARHVSVANVASPLATCTTTESPSLSQLQTSSSSSTTTTTPLESSPKRLNQIPTGPAPPPPTTATTARPIADWMSSMNAATVGTPPNHAPAPPLMQNRARYSLSPHRTLLALYEAADHQQTRQPQMILSPPVSLAQEGALRERASTSATTPTPTPAPTSDTVASSTTLVERLTDWLISDTRTLTHKRRQFIRMSHSTQGLDLKQYPGRLGHGTCVSFRVGRVVSVHHKLLARQQEELEQQQQQQQSILPAPAAWNKPLVPCDTTQASKLHLASRITPLPPPPPTNSTSATTTTTTAALSTPNSPVSKRTSAMLSISQ
jgi:hypothetical protein